MDKEEVKALAEYLRSTGAGQIRKAEMVEKTPPKDSIILSRHHHERPLMSFIRGNHLDCREVLAHLEAIYGD